MSINPNTQIVSFSDYVEIIGVPKDQVNNELVINRIGRWIIQATDQIDSMISGTGEIGKLYDWYETLKSDDIKDKRKKFKIKKAICSWVECMVITGKFWVNGIPDVNANINIDINSSSQDGFIENVRKDIIQDLVVLGLYNTTNFNIEASYNANQTNEVCDDFVVIPKEALDDTYLKLEPQKALQGPLDIAGNDFNNGGNITGLWNGAKPYLRQYEIIESDIDFSKNNIKGSAPLSDKADKILDPVDMVYKYINQFGVEYFGGLTKEQIYNAIYASGVVWNELFSYKKDWIVQIVDETNFLRFFIALQDNKGINPLTDPDKDEYWKEVEVQSIDLNLIVEQLKPFIEANLSVMVPQEVQAQLNELPTIDYVEETKFQLIGFENELDKDTYQQATGAQLTEYTPQFINDIETNKQDIVDIKEKDIQQLQEQIAKLNEYAKTGIIQVIIWNQNQYLLKIEHLQKPINLMESQIPFLIDKIHVSTTSTHHPTNSTNTSYKEWDGGQYNEILNPLTRELLQLDCLNTNNFRDNNIDMNLYLYFEFNKNIVDTTWNQKRIAPITSRYDRNGQVFYIIYKIK